MIHEYAIDPGCVREPDYLLRVLAGMGCEHGRLLAEFPTGWAKRVLETSKRVAVPPMKQKALSRRLELIRRAIVDTGRNYDDDSAWYTNARQSRPPFRAVVSPETDGCPELISLGTDLGECERWAVERGCVVPRKAHDLAAVLAPLIRNAREVVFVDPHFSPDTDRWRRPLVEFLERARRAERCEFHLGSRATEDHFLEGLEHKLGPDLPANRPVLFVRWKRRQLGEALHARYVLTEFGGVRIDFGLDEGDSGETTDLELLDKQVWARRRADFSLGAATFEQVGKPARLTRLSNGTVLLETLQR